MDVVQILMYINIVNILMHHEPLLYLFDIKFEDFFQVRWHVGQEGVHCPVSTHMGDYNGPHCLRFQEC